jgi:DTW domain-containing protein YfiP
METRTRFVFLMHPKEFKQEKAATGRLTRLCLANSELHMGIAFDRAEAVQDLIADERNACVLLYPGREAINLSRASTEARTDFRASIAAKRLVVFLLDATWAGARKMLRLSPNLQRLPRVMFTPNAPSRYVIKQQPQEGCLSTLEATHELLLALEQSGLDDYPDKTQLLDVFARMQDFQMECAADPTRPGYRRRAYSAPETRTAARGRSGERRQSYLKTPLASERQATAP